MDEDDLLGLAPDGVYVEEIPGEAIGSISRWKDGLHVVLTDEFRVIVDPKRTLLAVYPVVGPRAACHGTWREYRLGHSPIPGEAWEWVEAIDAPEDDPWGDRRTRAAGVVVSVRRVLL